MTVPAVRHTELLDQHEANGTDPLETLRQLGIIRDNGLYLHKTDITYDQLEAVGAAIGARYHETKFVLGDWLLLVEAMYPEKLSQAFEVLGVSPDGGVEIMRVSQKVPRSIRRKRVSWSNHRAVASLKAVDEKTGELVPDRQAQKDWLRRAEEQKMSHLELRAALRGDEPPAPVRTCRCCHRPL